MSGLSWAILLLILALVVLAVLLLRKRARNRRNRGSSELDVTLDDWSEPASPPESTRHHPTPEDPMSIHIKHIGDEPTRRQSPPREHVQPQPRREDGEDHYQPRRRYGDDVLIPSFVADQESTPRHEPTRHEIPDAPVESPTPPPSGGGWGGGHGNDGGSHGGGGGGTVSGGGGDSGGSSGGDS